MTEISRVGDQIRIAPQNKPLKLHMIGHAHLDPVWLWPWQEGFQEVKATFRSALDRMNEYEDFIFISSSAAFYEWLEQSDPGMFAELQQRVKEGRWQLVGGWWVEADANIPSGEALARQALYAQRYFMEKFGRIATVGFNPDGFGHAGSLPQLLKKSGLDAYVFMRPMPHEKGLPARLFWWEGDDGTRVLGYRIPFEYCSWGSSLEKHIARVTSEIHGPFKSQMCFYGVGNHGGGPTRENIESIFRLDTDPCLPELSFSDPEQYFAEAVQSGERFPVYHGDLQHHASGCYAAHSGVKRWNREAENRLLMAEKFSVLANWITGQPYPKDLPQAWKDVLFNQFHDILSGTCIEPAYEDARQLYGEALAIAGRAQNLAIQSLAWRIHVEPQEKCRPLVVFNPHPWVASLPVEMEVPELPEQAVLLDPSDHEIPLQKIQSRATANGRARIVFLASQLPAFGYRTYRFVPGSGQSASAEFDTSPTSIANGQLRLEIDPQTGWIRSLRDLQANIEILAGAGARPVVLEDPGDTWGHNIFRWEQVAGEFQAARVALIENGPVRATLRVESAWGSSTLVQDFSLYPDSNQVEVRCRVDWHEERKMLKLRFPLNLNHMRATYETPYGTIERFANGEEEPGQSWVDVSGLSRENGYPYGLSLLNDGKYSFDVNIRDLGMTVLRSPIYAHHMPAEPKPDESYTYMDQGVQEFRYTLLLHPLARENAHTVQKAIELNQPPIALMTTFHADGSLPQEGGYIHVEPDNVVVSVLKQAEDGQDLILRAWETAGEDLHAVFHLAFCNREIQADLKAWEVKTLRIPRDASQPVQETNLLEGIR